MKIRSGFVSNSSSSSYIIAFNNMNTDELEDLFVAGRHSGDQTSVDAVGVQNVIETMKEWYGIGVHETYKWGNEEEMDEHYHKQFTQFAGLASRIAKAIEAGDDVALVCISYGDNKSSDNLRSSGIRIIESFG